MTYTFGYDYAAAPTAAGEALDAWAIHGGYLLRYGATAHGVYVVSDTLDCGAAAVMLRWGKGWTWVDELDGHVEDIHAALCDVGASEPNIDEMIGGAMSCADWLKDRDGTVPRIIGTRIVYFGDEHRSARGWPVEIVAVLKGGAAPGADSCTARLTDDRAIAEAGGVTEHDRLEARTVGTSFVTIDPRAVDTDRFAHLAR